MTMDIIITKNTQFILFTIHTISKRRTGITHITTFLRDTRDKNINVIVYHKLYNHIVYIYVHCADTYCLSD